jgi:hypothetical protein
MDHNDFDKIFSDKLKETQDFEFMESDWENVLGRIDVPQERKRRGGWLWLFGLGFLMMAGTSLYLATSLKKTNQHLVELMEAMTKATLRVDTVMKEVRVIEYDTVVVFTEGSAFSTSTSTSTSIPPASGGLKTKDQRLKTSIPLASGHSFTHSLLHSFTNHPNGDWLNSTEQAIDTKTTTLLNTDKPANTDLNWRLATLKSNSWATAPNLLPKGAIEDVPVLTKVNQQKKLKNLSVGITGGMTLPRQLLVSESARLNNSPAAAQFYLTYGEFSTNRRNGFDAGLLLQYQTGKHWQLTGAVVYQQINYELSRTFFPASQERLLNSDYGLEEFLGGELLISDENVDSTNSPPISTNPNSDTISFGNSGIKQRAIEYRLGTNYVFRPAKKWRPFVGLSVSAMSLRKQELWGNFYEDLENGEFDKDNSANKISDLSVKASTFRWNGVVLSTGFQLAINKRLNWQMEAWYQQPFKIRTDQLYNLTGARTGLLYRF